jgi:hypothetical protein
VEPEETMVAREQHCKYLSAATNAYTTVRELLGHYWTI